MVYALTWLPGVLEDAGLKVAEVDGWRSRGRAEMADVRGVICHHTAGARTGNMPSLDLLIQGRSDLSGPLCQLGLGRDGTYYVIAAGRANHAGAGRWRGIDTGNSSFIGIEAENTGRADDPWPDIQMEAYRRGVAAILAHIGADSSMCCGHKEYALPPGRKADPLFEMAPFRAAVQAILSGQATPLVPIPSMDTKARPTLRRGDAGDVVTLLQQKLGITQVDGRFGPGTEAVARQFQRDHGLVPDGIFGPKSWAALDAAPAASAAASADVAAPAAALKPIAPIDTTPPVGPGSTPATGNGDLPPADDAAHPARVQNGRALTPDGQVFARVSGQGFYTTGVTSLARWLASLGAPPAGLSDAVVRVVRAMCVNEGGLEAINSYDNSFLSAGIFQWTAGAGSDPGELALLLSRFESASPAAYAECFGRYRLGTEVGAGKFTGRLVLDGARLDSATDKAVLRQVAWAYRFWRAGHHPDYRSAQLALAASRIDRFIDAPVGGRTVGAWLTSQYGIALVLDEHVNRPGHVPGTLAAGLEAAFPGQVAAQDPATWGEAEEAQLIAAYLDARAQTNMTDSTKRANLIGECVRTGQLSDDRGSFR